MGGPRLALIVVLASWFIGTTALAAPKVTETMKTYAVDATTAVGLKQQMRNRGPKGYWGYTAWFVRWSAACKKYNRIDIEFDRRTNHGGRDGVVLN
jgi:predicted secreted Zn-dependent protease